VDNTIGHIDPLPVEVLAELDVDPLELVAEAPAPVVDADVDPPVPISMASGKTQVAANMERQQAPRNLVRTRIPTLPEATGVVLSRQ
jgi:hypothetical protein